MHLNNFILIFFLIGFNILFYKYFLLILNRNNSKLLIDDQLNKPQAFHEFPVFVSGGVTIFLSFLILIFYFSFFKQLFYYEYFY